MPNLKKIGLLNDEVSEKYEEMGILELKDLDDGKEYLFEMYEDGDKISEEDIQILAEGDLVTYKSEYDDDMEQDIAHVAKLNK